MMENGNSKGLVNAVDSHTGCCTGRVSILLLCMCLPQSVSSERCIFLYILAYFSVICFVLLHSILSLPSFNTVSYHFFVVSCILCYASLRHRRRRREQ